MKGRRENLDEPLRALLKTSPRCNRAGGKQLLADGAGRFRVKRRVCVRDTRRVTVISKITIGVSTRVSITIILCKRLTIRVSIRFNYSRLQKRLLQGSL